jgi:hypothetical protein
MGHGPSLASMTSSQPKLLFIIAASCVRVLNEHELMNLAQRQQCVPVASSRMEGKRKKKTRHATRPHGVLVSCHESEWIDAHAVDTKRSRAQVPEQNFLRGYNKFILKKG